MDDINTITFSIIFIFIFLVIVYCVFILIEVNKIKNSIIAGDMGTAKIYLSTTITLTSICLGVTCVIIIASLIIFIYNNPEFINRIKK